MAKWRKVTELAKGDVIALPDGRIGTIFSVSPYGGLEIHPGAGTSDNDEIIYLSAWRLAGVEKDVFLDIITQDEPDKSRILVLAEPYD